MSAILDWFARLGERFMLQRFVILQCLAGHVYLVVVAMALAIAIGVPLGLLLTRNRRLSGSVLAGVGVIQTLPSLALVALTVPIWGTGQTGCIIALFLYALLPMVRNAYTGVKEVDPATIESARGMGMTSMQILFRIELPLSVPMIMAGIRTSTIICVGIATLGGVIGAGGLGALIWRGIGRTNDFDIILGAVPAMALALVLDRVLAMGEKAFTPSGLRLTGDTDQTHSRSDERRAA